MIKKITAGVVLTLASAGVAFSDQATVSTITEAMIHDSNEAALHGIVGKTANKEFCAIARKAIERHEQEGKLTKDEILKLKCLGAALGVWLEMGGLTKLSDYIPLVTFKCIQDGGYERGLKR